MAIKFEITNEERDKVLKAYIKEGRLDTFPSKEKRKYIILECIVTTFDTEKVYSEKEINDELRKVYHDFVTLRRYLVDYKFLERNRDGAEYRLNMKR